MADRLLDRSLSIFLELVAIDSPSGQEHAIAQDLERRLQGLGCTTQFDAGGNLYARLKASRGREHEPAILLNSHMDTVPIAVAVRPTVSADKVTSDGTTALGADDKAGLAAILVTLEHLVERHARHPAIQVLFTVSEETGLHGAKCVETERLLHPISRGYTLDSSSPVGTVITHAAFKQGIDVVFSGRNAHAGLAPEKGISAISMAAKAIDAMTLLRIDEETTANVGTIHGGTNTNIVCDRVELKAEARSLDNDKLMAQVDHMRECCRMAATASGGSFTFEAEESYPGYRIGTDEAVLTSVRAACTATSIPFKTASTGGGSDANILRGKGVPMAVLGVGYRGAHTKNEELDIAELGAMIQLLIALCTQAE